MHESPSNPFEYSPPRYLFERNDVAEARVPCLRAGMSRMRVGGRLRWWSRDKVIAAFLAGRAEAFIFDREVSVRYVDEVEGVGSNKALRKYII